MRSKNNRWMQLGLTALAVMSFAGITPQQGQLVELSNFVNARSEGKFRATDDNKVYELRKGTRAVIGEKPVEFKDPKTKIPYAYGLCLKIINAEVSTKNDCYWVYYKDDRKNLEVLNLTPDEQKKVLASWQADKKQVNLKVLDPGYKASLIKALTPTTKLPGTTKLGEAAVEAETKTTYKSPGTTKLAEGAPVIVKAKTPAIHEPAQKSAKSKAPATPASAPGADGAASQAAGTARANSIVVAKVQDLNAKLNTTAIDPSPAKAGCDGKCALAPLSRDASCKAGVDDYLEIEMSKLSQDPQSIVAQILKNTEPEHYIKDECFSASLSTKGIGFKTCSGGSKMKSVPAPCASANLKKATRVAFDLTMDCLGTYLTGDKSTIPAAAKSFFALVSHESGHNPNAVSYSGAGGATQLTDPVSEETGKPAGAISFVNRVEKKLMLAHLGDASNPRCAPVKQALEQGMGAGPANSCDRISLEKGNPLLNLIYGMGYQKYLKESIKAFITENPMLKPMFKEIEPQAKELLESQLTLWAHNTGAGGMRNAMRSMLLSYVRGGTQAELKTTSDVTSFLENLKKFVKTNRRNNSEAVNFLTAVNNRSRDLNDSARGGTCAIKN